MVRAMSEVRRKRELGRGERVLPGLWRLRLPLPFPGIPHCNAWALAAGDGVVLVDCGLHEPGSLANLERALDQVNLRLEHVRLLVCTHAHADHYGQAATVLERAGCQLWMHPNHEHLTARLNDPEAASRQLIEIGRASGVPEDALGELARMARTLGDRVAEAVEPQRALVEGVEISSDLGHWRVVETPGHAPSHIALWQPERRLLITGDHLMGRVSLYYDYGWTPDPAGEFLRSLDAVEALDVRLCLPGHGRSFGDVGGHIHANRSLVRERLQRLVATLREQPLTAFEAAPRIHDDPPTVANAGWWLTETLCYLRHLEVQGQIERVPGEGDVERWAAV